MRGKIEYKDGIEYMGEESRSLVLGICNFGIMGFLARAIKIFLEILVRSLGEK